MREFKKLLLGVFIFLLCANKSFCAQAWVNDLKSLYLSNSAIIYAVNIRTFNANDVNGNGIIEENLGEERGTFINAIKRLDEIASLGVNTVALLPVTKTGKLKALGTAGSLYAPAEFNELNPQLKSPDSKLTLNEEMKKFVQECHRRNIRVIVDLPACASYDLYLKNPELFKKDKVQNPIIPNDWTDVRLLDGGTNDKINKEVYNLYLSFIDLMAEMDVDGIRANVAGLKPASFWKKMIDETRRVNPQFLFLAEASSSDKSPSNVTSFTNMDALLDAGFDGYYGQYSNLKDWKTAGELYSHVRADIALSKKYSGSKKVLGNFSTHDQISPILINGVNYSRMITWLSATLPMNSYFTDGFATGDTYIYPLANKKAPQSFTDDDYYFVHRGQLDIFNLSRKPLGKRYDLLQDFMISNRFKVIARDILTNGSFVTLRTNTSCIFAYARSFDNTSIIVIGNLDFKTTQEATVFVPKMNNKLASIPIKLNSIPTVQNGKIKTNLEPGEIQVLMFNQLELK